jgi:tRNA(fMet)-specific endonuclease VapC
MFALDTNTVIYFFKGAGRVAQRLLAEAPSDIYIPAVVLYEIEVGIAGSQHPSKRREQWEEFLALISVLPFGDREARQAGDLEARLRKAGNPIGPLDTLIAGTALAAGATLVTRNVKEFRRVRGLSVIDWY